MKIIDLTHAINNKTPVYPGDPKVEVEKAGVLDKDGFVDHKVTFGTHVGTHMDAPAHMLAGGKQFSEFPVDKLIRPAICIDATDGFSADAINGTDIKEGDAVVFYTGASEYFKEEKYWHEYKVLDADCVNILKEKRVSIVGLDTGSADIEEGFPMHKALLGADILIIENLNSNLKELIGKRFELIALPLKLEIDGAPARVVARVEV